ncbi:hypothetical protein L798_02853 [Zootermopsis nevadensis]|uniref:Uncharacterized protein n=1 Tax=Zootermopsis nevadensis TaxID=136037 RepID=A0A067RQE2_ZOONE|nr:hypothetical protein L798_02853 [Zootermopsis nevadensis]
MDGLIVAYQSRGSSESVCLSAPGLAVAESCGAKTFHGHLDKPFDSRKMKYVFLRGSGFEHHIVGKHSGLGMTCSYRTKLQERCRDNYKYSLPVILPSLVSALWRE